MTQDDERRPGSPEGSAGEDRGDGRDASGERRPGRVPSPTAEEVPELLGEQSDYPIAWEPSADDDGER